MAKTGPVGTVIAAIALLVAIGAVVVYFNDDARSSVEDTVSSGVDRVRSLMSPAAPDSPTAEAGSGTTSAAAGSESAAASDAPAARGSVPLPRSDEPLPGTEAPTAGLAEPGAPVPPEIPLSPPIVVTAEPALRLPPVERYRLYLPGRESDWTRFDVQVTEPLLVQAAGQVTVGSVSAGPGGVVVAESRRPSRNESSIQREFVLPSAPYLSLIGRVCSSSGRCSAPFPLGRLSVVCPSLVGVSGSLELWTNNRIHVGGRLTRMNFSGVAGGFSVQTEPTWASACEPTSVAAALSGDTAARLSAGETLSRPEYTVSSRTNAWKPFFLPLHLPLRIQAAGEMRPQTDLDPTGPDGLSVPDVPRWTYPGSSEVVIDREHPLLIATMPYQALIGRVCSLDECTQPFLVGSNRVICADPEHRDRLELWVNQIVAAPGLLEKETPLTLTAFERQRRAGEYRFTVSQAPSGACGW